MIKMLLIAAIITASTPAFAEKNKYHEVDYTKAVCDELGGITEVVLADKSRVDCLTESFAYEADWASKWAEAIGQSQHYAVMTDKLAGIMILLRKPEDRKYLKRLQSGMSYNCSRIKVLIVETWTYNDYLDEQNKKPDN